MSRSDMKGRDLQMRGTKSDGGEEDMGSGEWHIVNDERV